MKTILIPVFNHRVSSRLDCTECFQIVKIDADRIKNVEKIKLVAKNQLEKLNLIISLKPDTVICNGLTEFYENEFHKNKINVIPWVHGQFEEVVKNFMNGNLIEKRESI